MTLAELDLDKIYSYADYYSWDFPERVELINGKVFIMNPVTYTIHQALLGELAVRLYKYLEHKPCQVFMAPFDVRFPQGSKEDKDVFTVLQPDICIVCDRSKLDERGCIGSPDIVVEILNPGNNSKDLKNKYDVYEQAGVKEYWVVSPQDQIFFRFTLLEGKYKFWGCMVAGDIVTSPLLPGFSLDIFDLFDSLKDLYEHLNNIR